MMDVESNTLALSQYEVLDLVAFNVDEGTAENTFEVFTAGVECESFPNFMESA